MKKYILCLCLILSILSNSSADENTRAFLDGIQFYKNGEYDKSAAEFHKIADSGIQNGKLFYNLGNTYLKMDDLGNAILWYEKALKLIPDDPDLKFNHEYALSLVKDEKIDKTGPVIRIIFFWKYLLSRDTVQWTAIILNAVFWVIIIIQVIKRKKPLKTPGIITLVLAVIFTLTAFYNFYESANIKQGVILPGQVSVRSGLADDSTELFVLHAGTKINIDKEKQGYFRIYYADGKIGWIKKSDAGLI
ncbi:Tetratricopeptide repeat-containing protein [Desulfonema limicola]|uniref:Tetratricopeptide repeat-containing protein n=1 Tax=Desulfonema limicola TaxID=45656 RepID=A0A975B9F3_9BACT|nr:tetratricopeptide repeat protein [Desulfonema limicola]QTA81277.1 Tetratricopeptide repeat-containing protein [Desulfonema limicola]